jgi:hypothetical protein
MDVQERMQEVVARHRKVIQRVLVKITIYYAILAAGVAMAIWINPDIVDHLPLGGVGNIANYGSSDVYDLEEAFLSADDEELGDIVTETARARVAEGPIWWRESRSLFYAMAATLLLMLPVSWVYRAIHTESVYDHSIDTTTLVLPAVVAGIVTVVQHSLALAFSLAGIVAGVRFRRALSDTFDTLFILASIGVGISAGIKSIEVAVVLTVFFNYASAAVCAFGDGLESQHAVQRERIKRESKQARLKEKGIKSERTGPMSNL